MPPRRHVAEGVQLAAGGGHRALLRRGALGHDDDRGVLLLEPLLDVGADPVDVERALRDEDDVGAAGQAGVQRDPAGVPAHDLDDQRAVVRLGRGVQPVDGVDGDLDRGVEAEGVVGGAEVVVDRLRDADDVEASGGQLGRDAEGVLAADRDQRVDAGLLEVLPDLLDPVVDLHDVGPAAAEDGASAREDAPGLLHAERHREPLERALPAVAEAEELVPVHLHALPDHGPDDGVQAGAVAPAGQDTDAHSCSPSSSLCGRPAE
jgi:hypothetical protein